MMRALCVWCFKTIVRLACACPWARLLTGAGCGGLLLFVYQQYVAQLGGSPAVLYAALSAIVAAWTLGWSRLSDGRGALRSSDASRSGAANEIAQAGVQPALAQNTSPVSASTPADSHIPSHPGTATLIAAGRRDWSRVMLAAGVSLWSLATVWLWGFHESLAGRLIGTSDASVFGYALLWSLVTIGVPAWGVSRLMWRSGNASDAKQRTGAPRPVELLGLALGLSFALFAAWGGLFVVACVGACTLLAAQLWLATRAQPADVAMFESPLSTLAASAAPIALNGTRWGAAVTLLACGGLMAWGGSVFFFLVPGSLHSWMALVVGLLLGIAAGSVSRVATASRDGRWLGLNGALLTALLFSVGFSWVVVRLVTLTGSISQVWLLQSVRWLGMGSMMAALGLVAAQAIARLTVAREYPADAAGGNSQRTDTSRWNGEPWAAGIAMVGAGLFLVPLCVMPWIGWNLTCYVCCWCLAGVCLYDTYRAGFLPRLSAVRVLSGITLALLLVGPLVSRGVQPQFASRLLFSSMVFQADQAGIPASQLPHLDDARLIELRPSQHGVYSVYKATMARHQIRDNGVPRGTFSTNLEICPRDTSELLLGLLPLTLHNQPSRVALLGLGAGVQLQTCLQSPVLEVTAVEADKGLVRLLKDLNAQSEFAGMFDAEEVTLTYADPVLWVARGQPQFDVIISNPEPSSLLHGTAAYTREFYRRAARQLTQDGIFCQRFSYHDYGPWPLQAMAATLRSEFQHVMAVEAGPGEIIWLGTNSPAGLVRADLAQRSQAAHVRSLMASSGWDWSVLLTLAAYDNDCLTKVIGTSSGLVHTASGGLFAVSLPTELMRWGPKSQETQTTLTAHAGKMLQWIGDAAQDEDLLRRLAEVRGQQELISQFPDQYWGYRSQVKKQISSRPLSRIQQVRHDSNGELTESAALHPDDKRRLRYFQQLSKAIHSQEPQSVMRLAEFDTPYDPLVSLFMHQELAEIAAKTPGLHPSVELTHRLHMLNYSPNFDRSVRNGLVALRLVLEKPEAVASDVARGEVICGLLQALQYRWQLRTGDHGGDARLISRDAEENIILAERALQQLPKWAVTVGYTPAEWEQRQRVIQRQLLGPLRDYRERLRPIAEKQRMDAIEEARDAELPSDDLLQFPGALKEPQD